MKSIAVSKSARPLSTSPTGKYPKRCRAFRGLRTASPSSTAARTTNVVTEQMMHDTVTDAMRPRMTEGASRERLAEGRVVEDM
jgi:hypothetical protein